MIDVQGKFLTLARRINKRLFDGGENRIEEMPLDFEGQNASNLIKEKLTLDNPCMIGRFGSVELSLVLEYQNSNRSWKYLKYVRGDISTYKLTENTLSSSFINAGIFPKTPEIIEGFAHLMLKDMKEIDVLGSWRQEESFFSDEIAGAIKIPLKDIEPYYHQDPWSRCLEGKKVLVVHPFAESIQRQYTENRDCLFSDNRILPQFELKVIKSVQSIAGQKTKFNDWFEALDHMESQIQATDFEVAIIGCGAYGLPLAAFVKRLGKKSVHLGGATQILFGIKGSRWLDHYFISKLFNPHWKFPLESETPKNFKKIENGCYW